MSKGKLSKREKRKLNKLAIKHWRVTVAIIVLAVMFVTIAYFMGWIDKWFKKDPVLSTAGGYSTTVKQLNDMKVNFLDVGQGDCIIIQLPDNKNMIIDSGINSNKNKQEISDFTQKNNIKVFDYLLLTHQDADHAGNMKWVIDNYQVNYIFRPSNYSNNDISSQLPSDFNVKTQAEYSIRDTYANFMVSAYNEKCTVEIFNKDSDFSNNIICNGETYKYSFNFLTPIADREKIDFGSNNNDYSPIMTLEYGGKTVMFTGDAEEANISEYVSTYGNSHNVDILKVGHHGSENATTEDFINAIDPEVAVIQCGLNNDYGHPHSKTLNILGNHEDGITIYRNDTNGLITLNIPFNQDYSFSWEKGDLSGNYVAGVKPSDKLSIDHQQYINNRQSLIA